MQSNREARNDHATGCRTKMAECLAEAWLMGERELCRNTINCGLEAAQRRQWKDDTAAALPDTAREDFLTYMRA